MSDNEANYGPVRYPDAKARSCKCDHPWSDSEDCAKCGCALKPSQQPKMRRDTLGRQIMPHNRGCR